MNGQDLSLGEIYSQALPAVCGALREMAHLERLELRVAWRTADATSLPLWAAAAPADGGGLRRLGSLSLVSAGLTCEQFTFGQHRLHIAPALAAPARTQVSPAITATTARNPDRPSGRLRATAGFAGDVRAWVMAAPLCI